MTTDAEHFGLTGPLVASGARLRIARVRDAPAADVYELIRAQVTSRTTLIATSAVSWIDGKVFPWRELRDATRPAGAGRRRAGGGCDRRGRRRAPTTTRSARRSGCAARTRRARSSCASPEALPPRLVAYPSAASYDIAAGTWEPKPGAARFDRDVHACVRRSPGSRPRSIDLPDGRFERARELAERCRELLLDERRRRRDGARPGDARLVPCPAATRPRRVAALYERGVVLRELPGTGLVRASVGWWNDGSDLERLVEALAA